MCAMRILKVLPFFKEARQLMGTLAEHEQWSRSKLEALQLARINRVWCHAINHVPHYRQLAREKNLPDRIPEPRRVRVERASTKQDKR